MELRKKEKARKRKREVGGAGKKERRGEGDGEKIVVASGWVGAGKNRQSAEDF